MSGDAKNFVECKISQKKIIVFSKTYCPYASKAKQVFNTFVKTGVITSDTLEIIELDELAECNLIVAYLKKITGKSSVSKLLHLVVIILTI